MPTSNPKLLLKLLATFRILLYLGLFFIGPNLLADTNSETNPDTIQEDHDTKNLDKLLIDYNKDQKKVLNDAAKINENDENNDLTEKELGVNQNANVIKSSLFKKVDPSSLKKIKYSEALKVTLEPLQKMSEPELVNLLKENSKNSTAAVYISRYPKITLFTVRLIKDKEAMPNLGKILDDEQNLIRFSGLMLTTIILGFFLKQFMKKDGRTIALAFTLWFFRFLIITSLRIGILIYFFGPELTPTFKIATKTFF